VADADANIHGQLVDVGKQVDVDVGDALPTDGIEGRLAAQRVEQCIEQSGFSRVDHGQRGLQTQHRLRRLGQRGHRTGVQGGGGRHGAAAQQGLYTGGNAGGHGAAGTDPDRFALARVDGIGAPAAGTGLQGAAGGGQGMLGAGREAVACGAGLGHGRRLRAAAGAHRTLPSRFEGGHVDHPLQRTLFQIEPPAIDHQQGEHQRQGQCQGGHQADRATLPGWESGSHEHSFAGTRPCANACVKEV